MKCYLLSRNLRSWLDKDDDRCFGRPDVNARKATLKQRVQWALEVTGLFAADVQVSEAEPFQHVARLVREHCEVSVTASNDDDDDPGGAGDTGGAPSAAGSGNPAAAGATASSFAGQEVGCQVRKRPKPAGLTLQSPFDPDAAYGHKGSGYSVQVTETCGNDGTEIITDFEINPANTVDFDQAAKAIDRLSTAGRRPSRLYADMGYSNPTALEDAGARRVTLVTPANVNTLGRDFVGRDAFQLDAGGRVVACPAGHAPRRQFERVPAGRHGPPQPHVTFDRRHCNDCDLVTRCVAGRVGRQAKQHATLNFSNKLLLRDTDATRQRNPQWWRRYATRSGIEATMSELKRAHGMARYRVRRMPRMRMLTALKMTACNAKRWLRANTTPEPRNSLARAADRASNRRYDALRRAKCLKPASRNPPDSMKALAVDHTPSAVTMKC